MEVSLRRVQICRCAEVQTQIFVDGLLTVCSGGVAPAITST
jgi:hypothetical protein